MTRLLSQSHSNICMVVTECSLHLNVYITNKIKDICICCMTILTSILQEPFKDYARYPTGILLFS